MKNKVYLFILSVFLCSLTTAQEMDFYKPNYKQIKKNIFKKKSSFYYPQLLARYQNADTSLSLKQKRHLYYGFVFQKQYFPYGVSKFEDRFKTRVNSENQSSVDWIEIIALADSILSESPFELGLLSYKLYCLEKLNQKSEYDKVLIQFRMIADVLLSSGDGLGKESAFYVINTSHEYDIIALLGHEFGGTQSLTNNFDFLTLADNKNNIEGLYFEISPCLNSIQELFK